MDVTNHPSHPSANHASLGQPVIPTRWLRMPALTDLWLCAASWSACVLPTLLVPVPPVRDAKSGSLAEEGSDQRTKRPLRSMGLVPPPTAGSFVPSARSQPVGQASPLKATIAPGGTTYWIISFHFAFVSVSLVAAPRVEYAAYPADSHPTVRKNAAPEMADLRKDS